MENISENYKLTIMKELSIEEKAKAYDMALAKAKEEAIDGYLDAVAVNDIFPELAESGDEEIRKSITEFFKNYSEKGTWKAIPDVKKWIDWLEKQGELVNSLSKGLDNAHERIDELIQKNNLLIEQLEKQGEQKPTETVKWSPQEESCICQLESLVKEQWRQAERVHNSVNIKKMSELMFFLKTLNPNKKPQGKSALEATKEEKVDNQNCVKPADKAEPKFKKGDWITNGDYTWKIVEVKPLDYILQSQDGNIVDDTISYVDEQFHSFNIQDAKDGDVLTCYSDIKGQPIEQTGIIKQYVGRHGGCSNSFKAHFGVDWDNNVVIEGYMGSSNIYPATKEQREQLEKAMSDAGYRWNPDEKKLEKIENKSTDWSEEDDNKINSIKYLLHELDNHNFDNWLKSFKDRVQPQKEWSEEDESIRRRCIGAIEMANLSDYTKNDILDWLKSLRPQNRWKPSDKQMRALSDINLTGEISYAGQGQELINLYQDLKKLREE